MALHSRSLTGSSGLRRCETTGTSWRTNWNGLQRVEAFKARHVTSPKAEPRIAVLLKEIREVDGQLAATRKRVGELKALLGGRGAVSFEQAFVRVAREMLDSATYAAVERQALSITEKCKARK
jgi:hypothetical protein